MKLSGGPRLSVPQEIKEEYAKIQALKEVKETKGRCLCPPLPPYQPRFSCIKSCLHVLLWFGDRLWVCHRIQLEDNQFGFVVVGLWGVGRSRGIYSEYSCVEERIQLEGVGLVQAVAHCA